MTMVSIAPYDSFLTELFTFLSPLSTAFVTMITDRLAANKGNREQRVLDRRIRRVQREIKDVLLPGISTTENAGMIYNEVTIEFTQAGDTAEMRTAIYNQFCFELLKIAIPVK